MKNLQIFTLNNKSLHLSALFFLGLFAFFSATLITVNGINTVSAQAPPREITGEWIAELKSNKPNEIYFMFQRRSEKGGLNMTSDNIALSEFQGLTVDAITSAKKNVNFSIVREAGIFVCEGYFNRGRGVGFWTLTPNEKFVSAMRARGYDNLTEQDLLSAALNNLTTGFIEELKTAGYEQLTFQELRRAQTHDLTLQFIREMKSAGFENLTIEQLIRARNHNINGEYVKQVRAMGFDEQPLEKLIRLRKHDITPLFISEMKSIGYEDLSIEQLIRLKNHNVTVGFINEIKAEGFSEIPAETAIRLRTHDVDRDFIRRAKAQGYSSATLEDLIRLRNRRIIK